MVNYRRNHLKGGTYFFTVNLRQRKTKWLTIHIELLREAFRKTIENTRFILMRLSYSPIISIQSGLYQKVMTIIRNAGAQ